VPDFTPLKQANAQYELYATAYPMVIVQVGSLPEHVVAVPPKALLPKARNKHPSVTVGVGTAMEVPAELICWFATSIGADVETPVKAIISPRFRPVVPRVKVKVVASTSVWTATFQNKADRELAVLDCAPIIVQFAGGVMVPDVALLTTCANMKSPRANPAGFVMMQFAEFAPGLAPTDRNEIAKYSPYAFRSRSISVRV